MNYIQYNNKPWYPHKSAHVHYFIEKELHKFIMLHQSQKFNLNCCLKETKILCFNLREEED